jgi:hypothetical protein
MHDSIGLNDDKNSGWTAKVLMIAAASEIAI